MLRKNFAFTAVANFDGTVERSDGRTFANLTSATPKNWETDVLGEALHVRARRVGGGKRRNDAQVLQHPTEIVMFDPRKVALIDSSSGVQAPPGSTPVGSYGECWIAPRSSL
jgi:hypothetical protein